MSEAATATEPKAYFWEVDDATYYADSGNSVSNSDCDLFLQSPILYDGIFNRGLADWKREATAAMDLGIATHAAVLESKPVNLIPKDVLTSNGQRRGKAWDEFVETRGDGVWLMADEYDIVQRIVESARSNPVAKSLLLDVHHGQRVEQAVKWECSETGLMRRCKLDKLIPEFIIDVKTFGKRLDAQSFANRVEEGGYYRQQAYYQDATEALGFGRLPFIFVVCQTCPPYSVRLFDLPKDWSERGRVEVTTTLRQIKMCRESGVWNEDGWGEVITIGQPRWATFKQEWQL